MRKVKVVGNNLKDMKTGDKIICPYNPLHNSGTLVGACVTNCARFNIGKYKLADETRSAYCGKIFIGNLEDEK
jgi:hypothetical protein